MIRRLSLSLIFVACDYTSPDGFQPPVPPDSCLDLSTPDGYVAALKCPSVQSCAFKCACSEPETQYVCPAQRAWAAMAHGPACGDFDGMTMPAVVPGNCQSETPTGDVIKTLGPDPTAPGRVYIPDGHYIQPAGHEQILHGPGIRSAFLIDLVLVPATRFAVAVDAGVSDDAIYSVDLDAVASDKPGLVTSLKADSQLDYGLAFVAPNHVYASGGADGVVYGYSIDPTTGVLSRDKGSDLAMGPSATGRNSWYVGGLAPSSDGTALFVASATGEQQARLVNLATKTQQTIDLGTASEIFGVFRDPYDPSSKSYWLSAMDSRSLLRVDGGAAMVKTTVKTGKNPEGIAFLGGTHVAAVFSDDDAIGVYDAVSGNQVQTLSLDADSRSGSQPGALAYDGANKRLYVTLSGIDAIGVYGFDSTSSAPLSPLGKIPTAWFPTSVRLRDDGSLVIVTAKGHGTGPALTDNTPELTKGSIAVVPYPQPADLASMTPVVDASRQSTSPTVACNGAYDFPIPIATDGSPSAKIQHVVYVIRENKTFDAIFGDLPEVAGDPKSVMSPGKMDEYWRNARAIAQAFSNFDNYSISAEQSLQGHVWTSFGRTTDYIERTWSATWGRSARLPKAGLDTTYGSPAEGGLFAWLDRSAIPYDDMGEIIGVGAAGFDPNYPGLLYSQLVPDQEKSCYIAARARALCDLKALSYVVLPNDHTKGTSTPGDPTPELMIAVNDVATGMILDALSHSPLWPTTLLVVTEDDPQDGMDHVDGHRTPLFMASPWIRRGYVSHTRIDTASLHKLFAHVFAKPYANERIAEAAIPYDAFTSTPDYTPFTYAPLTTKVSCNPASAHSFQPGDFSGPDRTPWLRREVGLHMRSLGKNPTGSPLSGTIQADDDHR